MCENCNKRLASVHIRKKINGQLEESYLCQTCAAKQGMPLLSIVNIDNYIANLLKMQEKANEPQQTMPVCPQCGYKLNMIQKTGRVGCAHCYEHYEKVLTPIIRKIHGGRIHSDHCKKEEVNIENKEINDLKKQLKEAVTKEEYETAAVLRDRIKELSVGERQ